MLSSLRRQDQPAGARCSGTGLAQQPGARLHALPSEAAMRADADAPWWRRWSIWVALALAALAIFLPVGR
jgi:hypothetical protein